VTSGATGAVTDLLLAWRGGDSHVAEQLMELLYADLKRRAAAYLRAERPGHTLQPTALVNEAYLRLVDQKRVVWQNRAHFLGVAAQMMRRILVDHARNRNARKRGGTKAHVTLDERLLPGLAPGLELLALDEALAELSTLDPQQGRIVELRAFGGLSVEDTAEVLGLSSATVKRHWAFAQAWLRSRLAQASRG
jgi:RNA polymerase sigma-70 factor, ECF subfamily